MAGDSIGQKAARSTGYLLIRRLVGYVIRFAAVAVLARKLSVDEFGIVAIATTCVSIMVMFGAGGIDSWVIYDREAGWEQRARSAWWLNVVLTTGQALVAGALIPVVAHFYKQHILVPVLLALTANFFVEQMGEVPDALLARRLQFRTVAARDLANDFLTGGLGVVMALSGAGIWSLVLPRLVLSPFFLLVTMRLARWTPGWRLYREDWSRIFKYIIHVIGASVLHVVANNGDTLAVGKLLGNVAVGIYNTAYILANLIGRNVTAVIAQVSMPVLAQIREATGSLASECVRMYRLIAIVTTPMLGGMFAISSDLVLLVYGPKWVAVAPLLRLFIVFTLVRSITSPSGSIFQVVGRPDLSFKNYLILAVGIGLGVGIGSMYGIFGVALGVTIARVVVGFLAFARALRLVEARVRDGLRALVPSTVSAGLMTLVVWATRTELVHLGCPLVARLAIAVPLGAVVYIALLRVIGREAFAELVKVVSRISPRVSRRLRTLAGAVK